MKHFCTYFDSNYLPRGLALYRSLERHAGAFRLFVLCLDDRTFATLMAMRPAWLAPISMEQFEAGDADLLAAKSNRSRIEYYFTCSPSVPLYILRNHPGIDVITYVDADLYFFSDPQPIYDEFGDGSILIVEHRFSERLRSRVDHGIYNIGLLSFRNDERGLKCLNWWRERCIEWCCDRVEGGRYADQRYLDDWPTRFEGVVVLQHRGAGLAPWNVDRYEIGRDGGATVVDGAPLVFYHFHGIRPIAPLLYESGLDNYGMPMSGILRRRIFAPYFRELVPLMRKHGGKGNLRVEGRSYTARELLRRLIYQHTLLACGPLLVDVHLEPLLHPVRAVAQAVKRRLGSGRSAEYGGRRRAKEEGPRRASRD